MHQRPLIEVLAEVPDHRQARGKRYTLTSILALTVAAVLCGARRYGDVAQWGRDYGGAVTAALGFTRGTTPCASTLHNVFKELDLAAFEARLQEWAERVVQTMEGDGPRGRLRGRALDGKTLRGSKKQGVPGTHLLSLVSHCLGLTLVQQAVEDKTNEIPASLELLRRLLFTGEVITVAARLAQRAIATTIVEQGGAYLMPAKDNQPDLRETIRAVLATPPTLAEPVRRATQSAYGHGRHERRTIQLRALLPGDTDWPYAAQVFRLERRVVQARTGEVRHEAVLGVTSLRPDEASPAEILRLVRAHWTIENRSHYVRDVTFDEDRSQVRTATIPQVLAAMRNLAIGAMRAAGHTNIAATCRRFAARPAEALALIGLQA
jgi:predicted transposase YbfD/YdcC